MQLTHWLNPPMFNYPVLVDLIREPQKASQLDMRAWEMVISQARRAGLFVMLENYLSSRCPQVHIPADVARVIRAEQCLAEKQQISVRWEATKLVRALQGIGLKPIFLKGAAYILADLEVARGRLLSDIDILVPVAEIKAVESCLAANGWQPSQLDEYDRHYFHAWMHEIPPLVHIKTNTTLDVHHTILALTAKLNPNADLLIEDAVKAPFEGAYVLAPVDMVLHSAAHLFHEGELEMGLKGLIDIERLLAEFTRKDLSLWDELVLRARLHQLERPLYYALHYCELILKLEVPEKVLQQIGSKPGRFQGKLMDFLYLRALMPDHPQADSLFTSLSRFLLYVRGHYLRMPIRVLVPHLLKKSWLKHKRKKQTRQIVGNAPTAQN
ncbi:nucleotidyltransferase family protein [Pseudomaricurvus alcaniphilus]|uniref:nucleotidyltransferase family protein n=1 Tax=Pseudomaricurvus alcaniphilus TaxID=1166482 RepID=UPI00140B51D3|nr:nucleotidyltransferase family protein [Pseudomaricurvus alcaniphilus]